MRPRRPASSSNCLRCPLPSGLHPPGMIGRLLGANAALLFLLLFLVAAVHAEYLSSGNETFLPDGNNDTSLLRTDDQDPAADQSSNNKSRKLMHFTNWSEWSVCDRHCTQNRVRRCRVKKKCGTTILREERVCQHNRKGRWRRCKHQQRRGHRQRAKFHVVQIPKKEAELRQGKRRDKEQSVGYYGKWSKWSPCTRLCTTQRHRWCKKPGICGRDVIRESAYCYVEGSFCQRWIRRKIRGSQEEDNDDLLDEFVFDPNTVDSFIPEKNSHVWKCGVSNTQKTSRLSYFTRIIGGKPSIPGSWPWQVAVLNRYREAFCGGTLVSPRWVLTAAHCIRKRLYVRIGEHDLTVQEGNELELRVDSITVHPEYDANIVDNDVAMLRLPVTLTMSPSRGIACLPAPNQPLPAKQLCTIIGWGKSRVTDNFGTDVLHEARIPIVSLEACRDVYVDYAITDNMFCAGYLRGRMDSCAGDSGGPLLCQDPKKPNRPWTIFGITSFGEGCGKRGKFGIYAKLSNYVLWINKVMEETDEFN
ncbi:transmembrane protease serine 11A isoform X2 [Ceratina calcarata]|uniref:Transmembrane protease serine 11A isoform X1 n=1 Tax=Ceratina calcarata TaxID=156304 RepID=A0AAJ7IU07_9HYME|nr:transmembrane protease serine 11A isoform X1 [Ceratina calcarata]XP_026667694.1 transmembrane protease serine 11A isoform X1 [Ceratina calcarata]XP_026667695.1 transmembrane protease serine 11A isoform X1 [Ceratina calcarata]XP_026667696.1 transmembrane protease serine 11A isoform X2 [Ceratina calcarata]